MEIVDKIVVEIDAGGANFDDAIGRVSVVGAGMKTNPGVAAQMFETLATEGVNIEMISTSTIRISCVVHENDVERAVRALHAAFELEAHREPWMSVGVVGATGLVGTEMLRLLHERAFPVDELRAYASPRSEGRALPFGDGEVTCQVLADGCFDGLDLVVIDVDDPLALEWAPRAVAAGARVVDNSAAFRTDPDVPLVVERGQPRRRRDLPKGIVSCPNCTTMVLVTALAPLHRAAGIERMVVSTYQSVSGAGQPGMHELDEQWTKGAGQIDRYARAATTA